MTQVILTGCIDSAPTSDPQFNLRIWVFQVCVEAHGVNVFAVVDITFQFQNGNVVVSQPGAVFVMYMGLLKRKRTRDGKD